MKFPKTAEDLKNEILISAAQAGDLRIRQLIGILPKADPEMVVEGVIQAIVEASNHFEAQKAAGRILEAIKPKSQKALEEVLKRTLRHWNKSIEEFPLWLQYNYGLDLVSQTFDQLELDEMEANKLETMKWRIVR